MIDIDKLYENLLSNKSDTHFFSEKGFSDKTLENFNIFYSKNYLRDPIWQDVLPNQTECFYSIYCYVIPGYDENNKLDYLIIRRDDLKYDLYKSNNKEHKHIYLGEIDRGLGKLWNIHHFIDDYSTIFIVESWTDALSLEEIGYAAIAMNRVANAETVLIKFLEKYADVIRKKRVIIMCDSDDIGKEANSNISHIFSTFNIKSEIFNEYPAEIKDANEWLVYNRNSFTEYIKKKVGD